MDHTPVIPAEQRGLELSVLDNAYELCDKGTDLLATLDDKPLTEVGVAFVRLDRAVRALKYYKAGQRVQNAGIASTST